MIRKMVPRTRRFALEIELEVNGDSGFSSGEVSERVMEALLALDRQGWLFPAVDPLSTRRRLTSTAVGAIGYGRRRHISPPSEKYRQLILGSKRYPDKASLAFRQSLDLSAETLVRVLLRQRLLMVKLLELTDKSSRPGLITDADLIKATALFAAINAVDEVVTRTVLPVL